MNDNHPRVERATISSSVGQWQRLVSNQWARLPRADSDNNLRTVGGFSHGSLQQTSVLWGGAPCGTQVICGLRDDFTSHVPISLVPCEVCPWGQTCTSYMPDENQKIHIASDGSFDPDAELASHGWHLIGNDNVLVEGTGPLDGIPEFLSSTWLGGTVCVLASLWSSYISFVNSITLNQQVRISNVVTTGWLFPRSTRHYRSIQGIAGWVMMLISFLILQIGSRHLLCLHHCLFGKEMPISRIVAAVPNTTVVLLD